MAVVVTISSYSMGANRPSPACRCATALLSAAAAREDSSLQSSWETIHHRDPNAGYFLPWRWMNQVFSVYPDGWIVVGVRPEGPDTPYVCFLPLRVKERWSSSRRQLVTEMEPAGRFLWGQYSGFVCDPAHEHRALTALTDFLRGPRGPP